MLSAWLAGKTVRIVVFLLAALAVPALPALAIQTARLNGISFFGWHLVQGALDARDAARRQADACNAAGAALNDALVRQNARIEALGKASAAAQARARTALSQARTQNAKAAAAQARILAARPGGDLCQSADALILESVK
jgi:hypothetical protein